MYDELENFTGEDTRTSESSSEEKKKKCRKCRREEKKLLTSRRRSGPKIRCKGTAQREGVVQRGEVLEEVAVGD